MIRSFLVLGIAICSLWPTTTNAQKVKYWVFFADHGGLLHQARAGHVSDRAFARRGLRGGSTPAAGDQEVAQEYVSRIEAAGAVPVIRSRWLNAVSAEMDDSTRDRVADLPFVREVRPVGLLLPASDEATVHLWPLERPLANPADPRALSYGPSITQLRVAGFIDPLESGLNGSGVTLGLIDTGTGDLMHPATRHIVESGRLIGQQDFSGQPADASTHARMVLSVAAGYDEGNIVGPAYGADILLARSEYTPTETNQEEDAFVAAMEWMEAQGADVVNVSLGYTDFDAGENSYTYDDMDGDTAVTTIVSDLAVQHGVVVVTSAGNSGCASPAFCWYYIGSPADGDSVITAGGIRSDSTRYSASSWGPTADGRIKPDVAAQAVSVYVASGSFYGYGSGTSFSSPMVAAAAVLLLQARPDLTPMEVRDILRATASQAGNPDNSLGWGIINARAALDRAVDAERHEQPRNFEVQTFPNPFSDRAVIRIDSPDPGTPVQLEILDLVGRRVWYSTAVALPGGTVEMTVDGRDLPPGLLVYRVLRGSTSVTGTLVHVR